MQKRILLGIFMIFLLLNICACSSTPTPEPEVKIQHNTKSAKPMEKFDTAVGRDKKNDTASNKADLEDLEMKHWKYNRDLQAAREASQQLQQPQSKLESTDQNTSQINVKNTIGQGNYYNGTDSYSPIRIDFLTEEDFRRAASQLMKLGYLNETGNNEQSFKAALSQFQKDQGLKSSGQLDAKTIKSLDSQANRKIKPD